MNTTNKEKPNIAECCRAMDDFIRSNAETGFTTKEMKEALGDKYDSNEWKGVILRNGKRMSDAMGYDKKTKKWHWL